MKNRILIYALVTLMLLVLTYPAVTFATNNDIKQEYEDPGVA